LSHPADAPRGGTVPHGPILIAHADGTLVEALGASLRDHPAMPPLVGAGDGATLLAEYVRAHRAGTPPRLVIVDLALPRLDGRATALSLRAAERGLASPPAALLFYTVEAATDDLKALLSRCGRAVHLQRPTALPLAEQVRRLTVAIEKLLAQLGGRA
jgi:CheY-like chemotaxis protein